MFNADQLEGLRFATGWVDESLEAVTAILPTPPFGTDS